MAISFQSDSDLNAVDGDVHNMSGILQRIVQAEDTDRIKACTALLNSFNLAVQLQAGRRMWLPADFRAFSIALSALDSIGQLEGNTLKGVQAGLETELERYSGGKPQTL